jgi:hypothetical protein
MKKLLALALMVVCVATFSMGCTPKETPKDGGSTPAAGQPSTPDSDGTPAAPTEEK